MIPVWFCEPSRKWIRAWIVSTASHGVNGDKVLITFDDKPNPNWDYPVGSMGLDLVFISQIRIRRTEIPLLEAKDGD